MTNVEACKVIKEKLFQKEWHDLPDNKLDTLHICKKCKKWSINIDYSSETGFWVLWDKLREDEDFWYGIEFHSTAREPKSHKSTECSFKRCGQSSYRPNKGFIGFAWSKIGKFTGGLNMCVPVAFIDNRALFVQAVAEFLMKEVKG